MSVQPCRCFYFWTTFMMLVKFLKMFLKMHLIVFWILLKTTFMMLVRFSKMSFKAVLWWLWGFRKCLLVVSWRPSRSRMVRIRNAKCLWQVPKFIFTIDTTLLHKSVFSVLENLRQFNMYCWLPFIYYVNMFILHTLRNI